MQCEDCTHQNICMYKSIYEDAQKQINKIDVVDEDLEDTPISIELNCDHYKCKWDEIKDLRPDIYRDPQIYPYEITFKENIQ